VEGEGLERIFSDLPPEPPTASKPPALEPAPPAEAPAPPIGQPRLLPGPAPSG
jgi:hypothetical protein